MGKVFKALSKSVESESLQDEIAEPGVKPQEELVAEGKEAVAQKRSRPRSFQPSKVWDERLILSASATGVVAENIRTLRTRILHPFIGDPPRSILVTSASPGEGKSFICANLGISLGQGVDNYSLVVDSDLRRPSQHKLFGLNNDRGLVDHLQHRENLEDLIVSSGVDKLKILPSGPPPVNPSELLGSEVMVELVDELVSRYSDRIVLLDSPPLHAAAETAILAQNVDGVLLVVGWGGSRREHVKALADIIGRERIIGVVFNAYQTTVLDAKVFGYYDYENNYYFSEK